MLNKIAPAAFSIVVLFYSCSPENRKDKAILSSDSMNICFENIQNLSFDIKTENLKPKNIPDIIICKGKIIPSPNEVAIVSVPIQGTIKKLYVSPGEFIKKGIEIAVIENTEILKMQEEYLISKSEYEYYKEDFKRQGELNLENATSMKVMQKAQYEFKKSEACLQSLKKKLELIGVAPDSVDSDRLRSSITIYAPISGYVSKVTANLGMFCDKEGALCIVSGDHNAILLLQVDESKISSVAIDQPVEFSDQNSPDKLYNATILGIEPNVNMEHFVSIYAQIHKQDQTFQLGIPVNAFINAGHRSTLIVPEESIINKKGKSFIFRKTDENCFALTEIITGCSIGNDIEILKVLKGSDHAEYVISGAQKIFRKYELTLVNVR